MRLLKHILTDAAVLGLVLGVPFFTSDYFKALRSGTDAVSSASVIVAQPSGNYVVLINTDRHPNAENLLLWEQFFTGEDAPIIFEDLSCLTAVSDSGGRTMADSFRSRLPENQMKVRAIDGTLLLSKAASGLFDVIILSDEIAAAYTAEPLYEKESIRVLHITGESE